MFNSRNEMRVSDAFPSEMPFISFRACLLFLGNVSEMKTGGGLQIHTGTAKS
jgi:hypothetical protein